MFSFALLLLMHCKYFALLCVQLLNVTQPSWMDRWIQVALSDMAQYALSDVILGILVILVILLSHVGEMALGTQHYKECVSLVEVKFVDHLLYAVHSIFTISFLKKKKLSGYCSFQNSYNILIQMKWYIGSSLF